MRLHPCSHRFGFWLRSRSSTGLSRRVRGARSSARPQRRWIGRKRNADRFDDGIDDLRGWRRAQHDLAGRDGWRWPFHDRYDDRRHDRRADIGDRDHRRVDGWRRAPLQRIRRRDELQQGGRNLEPRLVSCFASRLPDRSLCERRDDAELADHAERRDAPTGDDVRRLPHTVLPAIALQPARREDDPYGQRRGRADVQRRTGRHHRPIGSSASLEGTPPTSTQDATLRRKCSVTTGDTNGSDAFDPSVQWDGFPADTFTDLGQDNCP